MTSDDNRDLMTLMDSCATACVLPVKVETGGCSNWKAVVQCRYTNKLATMHFV